MDGNHWPSQICNLHQEQGALTHVDVYSFYAYYFIQHGVISLYGYLFNTDIASSCICALGYCGVDIPMVACG